jgi:environmental stress-induced protein Ves
MVLNYVINKQQELDFFAFTKDIPKQISKGTNNIRSSFNLQSQFANSEKYHEVIKKLIVTQNLRMDKEGNLIFIPISRKNAQYEAVTLFEALKKSGLLKNRERTYEEIGKILSNTFKDWNLSVRTIGDKKTFTRLEDYEAIIS